MRTDTVGNRGVVINGESGGEYTLSRNSMGKIAQRWTNNHVTLCTERNDNMLNDFVRTPMEITEALMKYEKFNGGILEPCCGDGAISKVLEREYDVVSMDKYQYGFGGQRDLFDITEHYDNIVTNPPFTQQQLVKKHLLSITKRKLALLWYVKNLGNEVETKTSKNLKTVYVFNKRINWVETKLGWLFAWYIWDKDYEGDITIKRIDL